MPDRPARLPLLRTEFGASHDYVSLERPDIRNRALADPVGFFAQTSGPLILDEIQYAPELLHYIKELIDARRKTRTVAAYRFSKLLADAGSESDVGRPRSCVEP